MKRMRKAQTFVTDIDADDIFGPLNETGTPERNLLMAIMVRALLDYVGNDSQEVEDASCWLFEASSESKRTPYTFAWICQQLDLDIERISAKIKAMPKRGKKRVAPWYFDQPQERLAG